MNSVYTNTYQIIINDNSKINDVFKEKIIFLNDQLLAILSEDEKNNLIGKIQKAKLLSNNDKGKNGFKKYSHFQIRFKNEGENYLGNFFIKEGKMYIFLEEFLNKSNSHDSKKLENAFENLKNNQDQQQKYLEDYLQLKQPQAVAKTPPATPSESDASKMYLDVLFNESPKPPREEENPVFKTELRSIITSKPEDDVSTRQRNIAIVNEKIIENRNLYKQLLFDKQETQKKIEELKSQEAKKDIDKQIQELMRQMVAIIPSEARASINNQYKDFWNKIIVKVKQKNKNDIDKEMNKLIQSVFFSLSFPYFNMPENLVKENRNVSFFVFPFIEKLVNEINQFYFNIFEKIDKDQTIELALLAQEIRVFLFFLTASLPDELKNLHKKAMRPDVICTQIVEIIFSFFDAIADLPLKNVSPDSKESLQIRIFFEKLISFRENLTDLILKLNLSEIAKVKFKIEYNDLNSSKKVKVVLTADDKKKIQKDLLDYLDSEYANKKYLLTFTQWQQLNEVVTKVPIEQETEDQKQKNLTAIQKALKLPDDFMKDFNTNYPIIKEILIEIDTLKSIKEKILQLASQEVSCENNESQNLLNLETHIHTLDQKMKNILMEIKTLQQSIETLNAQKDSAVKLTI